MATAKALIANCDTSSARVALVNSRDVLGMCPLHVACMVGSQTLVRELVCAHADMFAKCHAEQYLDDTPAHFAARNNAVAVMQVCS